MDLYVAHDYEKEKDYKGEYIHKRFEKSWFYSLSVFWRGSVISRQFICEIGGE